MRNYTELKRLVDRVLTDRRFCGDESHKALADGVLALIAENERLSAACTRAEQVINAESKAAAIATGRANLLRSERDQLKAENELLRKEVALDDKIISDRDRLLNMFECPAHGQCIPYAMEQVEALRKEAPSKEIIWCACGDGHAANSYGAGFMDANKGVCANCDAAIGKGEQSEGGLQTDHKSSESIDPEGSKGGLQ